jgi:hypothetical protein
MATPSSKSRSSSSRTPPSTERKEQLPLPQHLSIERVELALSVLANNRKVVDSKSPAGLSVEYETTALSAARGLFSGGQVYHFRGTLTGLLTTPGSAVAGLYAIGNNLAAFNEGTSLAALFDECRVRRTRLQTAVSGIGDSQELACVVGYNTVGRASTDVPTTAASVARLEGSLLWTCKSGAGGAKGRVDFKSRARSFPFCDTGAQYTLSPPSGTIGCWWISTLTTTPTVSIRFANYMLEADIELRSRA